MFDRLVLAALGAAVVVGLMVGAWLLLSAAWFYATVVLTVACGVGNWAFGERPPGDESEWR